MKKNVFLALLTVLLIFAFVDCDNGNIPANGSKKIKITGFNLLNTVGNEVFLFSESTLDWPPDAWPGGTVTDGQTITNTMVYYEWDFDRPEPWWNWDWDNPQPWNGIGKYFVLFQCSPPKYDPSKSGANYVYSVDGINPAQVDIKYEVTTLEWSKFIWIGDYAGG